ncbi:MAG TPA: LacI family DNA-binding transcriptional regulator [Chthonomonadaceae bacterium]|nr:LacI family DNA-binding transcriptional regulator [Chthonomonadaceae bacterium]
MFTERIIVRVTIKKIAQELGISHSTVSRVLNDKQSYLVSEATRERILEAATRMGYRPNRIAQALQGKSTQLIGVFLPDAEDYFFQSVLRHLRHTLEESDYELMEFTCPPDKISATWHRLLQWDLDGVFAFDYLFYVDGLWEALSKHRGAIPPIVGLFSSQTRLKDFVTLDFRPALEELLSTLLQKGRRRLGYMSYPTSLNDQEVRYSLFRAFTTRHGLEQVDIAMPYGQPTHMEAARQGMLAWIGSGQGLPEALFCQNDEIALGAYRAFCETGIQVPEQVALAGCDDLPYVSYLETPLTSLSLPVPQVCRQGWSILQKRIAEPEGPPMQVIVEAELRLRASCP